MAVGKYVPSIGTLRNLVVVEGSVGSQLILWTISAPIYPDVFDGHCEYEHSPFITCVHHYLLLMPPPPARTGSCTWIVICRLGTDRKRCRHMPCEVVCA